MYMCIHTHTAYTFAPISIYKLPLAHRYMHVNTLPLHMHTYTQSLCTHLAVLSAPHCVLALHSSPADPASGRGWVSELFLATAALTCLGYMPPPALAPCSQLPTPSLPRSPGLCWIQPWLSKLGCPCSSPGSPGLGEGACGSGVRALAPLMPLPTVMHWPCDQRSSFPNPSHPYVLFPCLFLPPHTLLISSSSEANCSYFKFFTTGENAHIFQRTTKKGQE